MNIRIFATTLLTVATCLASSPSRAEAQEAKQPPFQSHFGGKISVTAGYGHIYSIPFYGVGLGAEIGSDLTKSVGIYGGIQYERSRTEYGLSAHFGQLSFTIEGIFDIVRLGFGLHTSYFGLERISNDSIIDKFGLGFHLAASFDVIHTNEFSIYLQLKPQIDTIEGLVPNAHAAVGVRF